MFQMSLKDTIWHIVDLASRDGWQDLSVNKETHVFARKGVSLSLSLRMEHPIDPKNLRYATVSLVIFGNRFVFVSCQFITGGFVPLRTEDYHFLSNHDSCWIYEIDSYLSDLYIALAREIDVEIKPADMQTHCMVYGVNPCIVNYKKTGEYDYEIVGTKKI